MLLWLSHFFLPFITLHPAPPIPSAFSRLSSCPSVIHISSLTSPFHTIINLPLSILYLPVMLLIPCTFFPILPTHTDNPPCDLHFCDSVPVLVVCLICFCICFLLGSVVDSCVCWYFTVHSFDLLFLR